jgi:hypothetical protein
MLARIQTILLPLGALVALFLLAPQARAMCVYNDMDVAITVAFDCGFACGNTWSLPSGGQACRPSTSGHITLSYDCSFDPCMPEFSVPVEAHGYAVLYGSGGGAKEVCSYHSDDTSALPCLSFTYP